MALPPTVIPDGPVLVERVPQTITVFEAEVTVLLVKENEAGPLPVFMYDVELSYAIAAAEL